MYDLFIKVYWDTRFNKQLNRTYKYYDLLIPLAYKFESYLFYDCKKVESNTYIMKIILVYTYHKTLTDKNIR
jgi:hypothetical protein